MSNNVRKIVSSWFLVLGTFVPCLTVSTGRAVAQELFLTWGTTEVSDNQRQMNPEHLAYPDELADQVPELFCIGKLLFRVSDTCQVLFAPGNLQYNAVQGTHRCADGSTAAGSWRFAPNQWEYIGSANAKISSTYDGWIDLFAWGSSGYDNIPPYSNKLNAKIPFPGEHKNIAGTNYDWGVWCGIGTDAPGTWRTLTREEWDYLFKSRENARQLYAYGSIEGVNGLIVLPDEWEQPADVPFGLNYSNSYTETEWRKLESAGAVFLPYAGSRYFNGNYTLVERVGSYGSYWTASCTNRSGYEDYSMQLMLPGPGCGVGPRGMGMSVRLVQNKRIIKP